MKIANIANIANYVTLFRVALIPFIVFFLINPNQIIIAQYSHYIAAGLFFLCGVSDWLDGYIARTYSQETKLGSFLDPFADKLVIVPTIICVLYLHPHDPLLATAVVILALREVFVSGLRERMSEIKRSQVMAVSIYGKAKTFVQFVSILLLIIQINEYSFIYQTGYYLFMIAVLLTLISLFGYLKKSLPYLFNP